jgi:hypothetical protein
MSCLSVACLFVLLYVVSFKNTFRRHPILPGNFLSLFPFLLELNLIFGCSKILFHGLQIFYLDSSSLKLSLQVFLQLLEFKKYFFMNLKRFQLFSGIVFELKINFWNFQN